MWHAGATSLSTGAQKEDTKPCKTQSGSGATSAPSSVLLLEVHSKIFHYYYYYIEQQRKCHRLLFLSLLRAHTDIHTRCLVTDPKSKAQETPESSSATPSMSERKSYSAPEQPRSKALHNIYKSMLSPKWKLRELSEHDRHYNI